MIHTNPGHLRRSGTKLGDFGEKLADGGQRLESAGQRLVSHASGDRSGIGSVISKAFGKGVQITGKVQRRRPSRRERGQTPAHHRRSA
jgi:hypothetical protein